MLNQIPNGEECREISVVIKKEQINSSRVSLYMQWVKRFQLEFKNLLTNFEEVGFCELIVHFV